MKINRSYQNFLAKFRNRSSERCGFSIKFQNDNFISKESNKEEYKAN